jgi:hypothetical protein
MVCRSSGTPGTKDNVLLSASGTLMTLFLEDTGRQHTGGRTGRERGANAKIVWLLLQKGFFNKHHNCHSSDMHLYNHF